MNDIEIIYQDEQFLAVNKPEGLLVHKTNIDKYETRFLLQELRDQIGQYIYPVHRLDKPTSGLIIFALNPTTAALLHQQIEDNTAKKDYLLICRGYCPASGTIDHPLKPIDEFKSKRQNPKQQKPAKAAITTFTRLNTIELPVAIDKYPASRYSLVKATILTGRKHQIRRHFKHISHPIIGCPKYGKSTHNIYFSQQLQTPRLLLHSYQLSIKKPDTGEDINLTAPVNGSFKTLLEKFGWDKSI
ncbi:MAG: pseudouridine synthase [Spongiibacteraceae bacterium]